jgi:hypothetical protein
LSREFERIKWTFKVFNVYCSQEYHKTKTISLRKIPILHAKHKSKVSQISFSFECPSVQT